MMKTETVLVSSTWFTVAGIIYFRGVLTSDRNFGLKDDLGKELQFNEKFALWKELGPIPWHDIRVILYTALLTASGWFAPWISGTKIHEVLVYITIGAFFSPLSLPSELSPNSDDLRHMTRFVAKWFFARFDGWIKTILLVGVCTLLALIPGISNVGNYVVRSMFPVVPGMAGSGFFDQLLEGSLAAMGIMYFIRQSSLLVYGYFFTILFGLGTAFVWIQLQWFLNEVFLPRDSLLEVLCLSALATFLLDFLKDILSALIDNSDADK